MISLRSFIKNDNMKLSSSDKQKLIDLDNEYKDIYTQFWNDWYDSGVENQKEEFKKFINARKNGKKYFPQLKLSLGKLDNDFLEKCRVLKSKFLNFNCYLSKFYIEKINEMYNQACWCVNPCKENLELINDTLSVNITDEIYDSAMEMLKSYPWKDVSEDQTMYGKDVVPKLQKHINKLEYDYKAVLNPHLLARMKVVPNKPHLEIKTSAKYSDIDVESLKVHEVEVHCGRRYYGMKLGLYLMLDGLYGRNTLDEGMAIYNSMHYNPLGVKPNLQWKIAIKIWIAKHIDLDFCELFERIKEMCPTAPDVEIFENLLRFKRMLLDCSLPGGDCLIQSDYFIGYQMIKKMDKSLRDDILHYNIGPDQLKELDKIKKFFKLNKFKPITEKDLV